MTKSDFTLRLMTEQTPQKVFETVNNVRDWWCGYYSEKIVGDTEKLNDEFTFTAAEGAHYCKIKLVEIVPGKKIVWLVTDSELSFVEEKYEWTGSKIVFEISKIGDKTPLVFTHQGLTPEI